MTGQDEREVLLELLTHLPAGVTEEGQEIPLLHMLPESAREYLRDAILTAGFRMTPAASQAPVTKDQVDAAETALGHLVVAAKESAYNCDCQVGGVDALSLDTDWLQAALEDVEDGWAVLKASKPGVDLDMAYEFVRMRSLIKALRHTASRMTNPEDVLRTNFDTDFCGRLILEMIGGDAA